jgi:HSP20 family protein
VIIMANQTQEKTNGSQRSEQRKPLAPVRPLNWFALDPFRSFDAMRRWMDSFVDFPALPEFAEFEPAVNVYEKDGVYTVECAVPGYKKDDISVEARGDEVTISGSYSRESEHKNHYHRKELRQGSFTRVVELPEEIDPEHVDAKLENGMLKIALRPTHPVKAKSIPITAA